MYDDLLVGTTVHWITGMLGLGRDIDVGVGIEARVGRGGHGMGLHDYEAFGRWLMASSISLSVQGGDGTPQQRRPGLLPRPPQSRSARGDAEVVIS